MGYLQFRNPQAFYVMPMPAYICIVCKNYTSIIMINFNAKTQYLDYIVYSLIFAIILISGATKKIMGHGFSV